MSRWWHGLVITWLTDTVISLLTWCLWLLNLAGWQVIMMESSLYSHMALWSHCFTRSCYKLKPYLHYQNAFGPKRGRKMIYLEQILTIKSHGHIIMWSCEITWDTKIIIYPLPQCLWLPNLARWEYTMRNFLS